MTAYRNIEEMLADPDLHPHGKAEIATFARFLIHHGAPGGGPGSRICSCGVAAHLEGERVMATPNPACDCPCHEPGYAVSKS